MEREALYHDVPEKHEKTHLGRGANQEIDGVIFKIDVIETEAMQMEVGRVASCH